MALQPCKMSPKWLIFPKNYKTKLICEVQTNFSIGLQAHPFQQNPSNQLDRSISIRLHARISGRNL